MDPKFSEFVVFATKVYSLLHMNIWNFVRSRKPLWVSNQMKWLVWDWQQQIYQRGASVMFCRAWTVSSILSNIHIKWRASGGRRGKSTKLHGMATHVQATPPINNCNLIDKPQCDTSIQIPHRRGNLGVSNSMCIVPTISSRIWILNDASK